MSNSFWPQGLQHTRLPCPSPTPGACWNSCPSSQWCHPTISSSVILFSSCFQPFTASESFPMSQFFPSNGRSIEASAPVLPVYSGLISFRIDWFNLLALQGTLKSLLQYHCSKASILWHSAFFIVQLSHSYMTTRKTIALTIYTFVGNVMSLLFNTLSRFITDFLPRSNCLNFMTIVTVHSDFGAQENEICHCFYFFPFYLPWSDGTRCHDLNDLNVKFQASFILSKRLFSSSSLSAIRVVSSAYLRLLIIPPAILIPACESSSPAFCVIYSACKWNKQTDNIQTSCIPFPILN